ncbi:MAG: sulfatase-like hydrolase/transferase [Pseudomonadota bacterium]
MRFTRVFTTAGICAPSRAAHILGVHQVASGTQHMRTSSRPQGGYVAVPPAQLKAYPELLRGAGYFTFTDDKLDYQFSGAFAGSGPASIWDAEGVDDWRGRATDQPFFGLRNFLHTHESGLFAPLGSLPHSMTHFVIQLMRWWGLDDTATGVTDPSLIELPPYYPDTPTVRADMARHYDNISAMDAAVGRLLQQLESDGLADSTIVIWTSDHGDGLPRAKRELRDSGIHVPMIVRWPDRLRPDWARPGSIDGRLVSFVDLAPAVLALAGVAPPRYLVGSNFLASADAQRDYIFAARDRIDEVPDRQRAVRDGRFKYIRSWRPDQSEGHELAFRENIDMVRELRAMHRAGLLTSEQELWFSPVGKERLYDLEQDPHELHNLVDDPAYAQDLRRLRTVLSNWCREVGDEPHEPESAMLTRINPANEQPQTSAPSIAVRGAAWVLTVDEPGASISYRLDGGNWRVYTQPVPQKAGANLEAKAQRYGWRESEIVAL